MRRATRLAIGLSILALAVRFIGITQPFIDNWSWRQSDVAAIARNFAQGGFDFFHPRIDWAGNAAGYVGTEFPLLPFAVAIAYNLVGERAWLGRVETILFFAISLPFFFLLVRDLFGEVAAVWSLFFYSFAPLSLFASREFMPDIPSLSLAIAALYCFRRALAIRDSRIRSGDAALGERAGAARWYWLSAVSASLSILLKLPNVVVAAPLAIVAGIGDPADRHQRCRLKLLIFAIVAFLPTILWYVHAWQIAQQFYPHHYFGAGGIRVMSINWYWRIFLQLATASLTPLLFVLGLTGVVLAMRDVNARTLHAWLVATLLFVVVAGYGSRHQWYQLPLVPIAAAFAGLTCTRAATHIPGSVAKRTLSILLVLAFAGLTWFYVQSLHHSSGAYLRRTGLAVREQTGKTALIVAADDGDPTLLYYAQRKGWHFPEQDGIYAGNPGSGQQLIVDLVQLRGRGATHLALTVSTLWWLDAFPDFAEYLDTTAALVQRSADCALYDLK